MAVKEVERGRSTTATATAKETLLQGREGLAARLGQRGQEGPRTEAWLACWKSAALYSVGCSPPKIQSANVSVVGALRAGPPTSRAANSISLCALVLPRSCSLHVWLRTNPALPLLCKSHDVQISVSSCPSRMAVTSIRSL